MSVVAVLMGGPSAEREVSLVSGRACALALRELGHEVREIDVGRDVCELVRALEPRPDAVFNALHGRYGEDGCVQGVLNFMGLPYTHSGLLASALAMDKPMAKKLFAAAGIPVAEDRLATREEVLAEDVLPRPYVVKPANEGSSVGVHIVLDGANAPVLSCEDWPFGDTVMVERFVPGRELTVAVMDTRAMAVTEIRPRQGFYDYTAKYSEGKADHLVPAPVPEPVYAACLRHAEAAHEALGCRGVSRADFRYDAEREELIILEVNTQPGMTPLSLVPEQARHLGIGFTELVGKMLEGAKCDS